MRWFLQSLGAGSCALWAILLTGTLLTATSRADEIPVPSRRCADCCSCSQNDQECSGPTAVRGCSGFVCDCECYYDGSPAGYLCRPNSPASL